MSRNGSGVYSLPAGNPVVTGTTISSSWANTTLSDIATALTGSVAADGQTAMTGNLQMGNNKVTGLAAATSSGDALSYGQAATVTTLTTTGNVTIGGTLTLTGGLTLNGNVTVGDSSSDTLTVNATSTFAAGATFSSTFAANGGTTLGDASGDALTINSSAVSIPNGLNFDSNTLVIDATNNRVGVGTGSPSYRLDIHQSGASPSTVDVSRFYASAASTSESRILFGSAANINNAAISGLTETATQGALKFYTDTGDVLTEKMRITSAGNVGIGTSSPNFKLENTTAADIGNNAIYSTTAYAFGRSATPCYITAFRESFSTNSSIVFHSNNNEGTAPSEKMRLTSSGNLGLGVTPSAASLPTFENAYGLFTGQSQMNISTNCYYNGGWKYQGTGYATRYYVDRAGGQHQWLTAPSGTAGNAITFTQAMTLDASGNLLVGETSGYLSSRVLVKTTTTDSSTNALTLRNSASTDLFRVRSDGYTYAGFYPQTTGSAANVFIGSGGDLLRSTSSLKYKQDVQNTVHGLAEVMQLRSVTYKGKSEADGDKVFGGLIAEEVHEAGLTEFVQYAEDGSPDALAYGNMVSLAFKAIQEQQAIINDLKARIETLESK